MDSTSKFWKSQQLLEDVLGDGQEVWGKLGKNLLGQPHRLLLVVTRMAAGAFDSGHSDMPQGGRGWFKVYFNVCPLSGPTSSLPESRMNSSECKLGPSDQRISSGELVVQTIV